MSKCFQRILLATEHGEFDVGAERMALALAAAHGAALHAVIAIASNPEAEAVAPELMDRIDDQAALALSEIAERAKGHGVAFSSEVVHCDDIAEGFARKAREYQADLLIVRRRGHKGWFSRVLVGEMVSRLIDQSPCDVLIAPRFAQIWSKGILVLTNDAGLSGLERGAVTSIATQKAGALATDAGIPVKTAPLEPQAIAKAGESADLVVINMPAEQKRRLSAAHKAVIGAASCPVLLCLAP